MSASANHTAAANYFGFDASELPVEFRQMFDDAKCPDEFSELCESIVELAKDELVSEIRLQTEDWPEEERRLLFLYLGSDKVLEDLIRGGGNE